MNERLGIAACRELVSRLEQPRAKLMVVVDLAVVDDGDVAGLIGDRLLAPGDVDDAEAAHPEGRLTNDPAPVIVGAPVPDGVAHPVKQHLVAWAAPARSRESSNAAHQT